MGEALIGTIPMEELEERYRFDLYDDFLPFLERSVVDEEIGGFMCHADRDGTRLSSKKDSWYQGRGIWVYSFLYHYLSGNGRDLEIARRAVDFVLNIRPRHGVLWPREMSRTGDVLVPDREIYGSLFVAEGLAEFSHASGERHYWDLAREILFDCLAIYDRDDYPADPNSYFGGDLPPFYGARVQGVSMVLLRLATRMLVSHPHPEIEALASLAIRNILERHWNPEFELNLELLNHDYSAPTNDYARFVYAGHAIEALWMIMDEAQRRGDEDLFDLAAARFRRHVEVAWDDLYGGYFRGVQDVDRNTWFLDKVLWEQEEVLIGCLMLVEYRNDPWAHETFDRTFRYVQDRFALRGHNLPLYLPAADRKVTFERHYHRIENYHHPRYLMLNLLALRRMIASRSTATKK